jgi:hypothetical protein
MAQRIKTVEYGWPSRTTIVPNNTLTSIGSIVVRTFEGGEINPRTFLSAIVRVSFVDAITATGGTITVKELSLFFNSASTSETINNATTIANSGENIGGEIVQDFTNYFNTHWVGGQRTVSLSARFNQSTGSTLGMINVSATLELTYSYDDTFVELAPGVYSPELKTVRIPLNAPPGPMATALTTYDTLPALNDYLPEENKNYVNAFVVIQGNQNGGNNTVDHTLTLRLGSFTHTTGNFERALASDIFYRYIWNITPDINSIASSTQLWRPTSTVARNHHFQAYLVVTYEYDELNSTQIMNSLMLPMEIDSPFGGTTTGDSQSSTRDLWIQEEDIGVRACSFFVFWTQIVSMSTLHMRAYANDQPNSYVGYTDAASVVCGCNAAMIRNDSLNLGRGLNKLTFEAYRTNINNYGWNVSGFWIINYVSSKHPLGAGSHNKTIIYNLSQNSTDGLLAEKIINPVGLEIPEENYYINAIGSRLIAFTSGTVALSGFTVQVEKLQNEDPGNSVRSWENCYRDIQQSDPEIGVFYTFSQIRDLFKRYPQDIDLSRMDLATPRRWRIYGPQGTANTGMVLYSLSLMLTYHSITYPVNGNIVGSFPGSKTVRLFRDNPPSVVKQQVVVPAEDTFSFSWYDNTSPVFARLTNGDGTFHYSQVRLASSSNDFSIQREAPSNGPTYYSY